MVRECCLVVVAVVMVVVVVVLVLVVAKQFITFKRSHPAVATAVIRSVRRSWRGRH